MDDITMTKETRDKFFRWIYKIIAIISITSCIIGFFIAYAIYVK